MAGERNKLDKDELREDEFVEAVMRGADYVRDRYQYFVGGLVVIALLIVGVDFIIDSQDKARARATAMLGDAMLAEDEVAAGARPMDIYQDVIAQFDGTPAAAQAVLMLANRHLEAGDFQRARQLYQQCLDDYGETVELVYAARGGLAACLEAEGDPAAAADEYERYAREHGGTVQAAMALWEAARCAGQAGDGQRQRQLLERIVEEYAELPVAREAEGELEML